MTDTAASTPTPFPAAPTSVDDGPGLARSAVEAPRTGAPSPVAVDRGRWARARPASTSARGRRVRRTVRRVDPVSVLRVSAVFYACVFVVLLVAGVVLWLVAAGAGIVGNIESFIGDLFALEEFRFEPLQILQASLVGGLVLVVLGTAANVLAALLFNLIADLVGGVELTVVEDDAGSSGPRSVV